MKLNTCKIASNCIYESKKKKKEFQFGKIKYVLKHQ